MNRTGRRSFIKSAAAAGAALGSGVLAAPAVWAQAYPNKPIKFIVPLAPGGAIDFIARALGERLSATVGHQIVVENRTGAGGTIGMDAAMKSDPDGYTILITNDNAASAPHIMHLSYDYTKELLPVCYLGRHGQILAAHKDLGVRSVKELVDYVKANPGLGLATSGVGSNQHVLCEWFKREANIKIDHVPYRGAGQAINDLIAAHVKVAMLGPTSMIPHWKAGTLNLLAQSTAKRNPTLPEIPTFVEAGYKDLVLEAWYGAFAPKGTPPEILSKLNTEMNKALKEPDVVQSFDTNGYAVIGGTPKQFADLLKDRLDRYGAIIKAAGIQPE